MTTDTELDEELRATLRRFRRENPAGSLTADQLFGLMADRHPELDRQRLRARVALFWELLIEFRVVRR